MKNKKYVYLEFTGEEDNRKHFNIKWDIILIEKYQNLYINYNKQLNNLVLLQKQAIEKKLVKECDILQAQIVEKIEEINNELDKLKKKDKSAFIIENYEISFLEMIIFKISVAICLFIFLTYILSKIFN